jgi:peptidoglycan/xylan/chitin deacetylase (PgdA/CDA1 family)
MPSAVRAAAIALMCACLVDSLARAEPANPPTQYVIISFDSAQHVEQWKRSRALAQRTRSTFTYFLSCVYLLSSEHRREYQGPGENPGRSNIGFGASKEDVAARLEQIWLARTEGQEIGSHGCGHFDGSRWSRADWNSEFRSFRRILENAWTINGIEGEPAGWRHFARKALQGFRAPYLATDKELYQALADSRFTYDASGVSRGPGQPAAEGGVIRFALPQIPEGPASRPVIAMDYNMFVRHSGGFERDDKDAVFENRAYEAFQRAFRAEYDGKRTPLELGFHFTLMNGGAYWRALERFADEVCVKPDVACVSYADCVARNGALSRTAAAQLGG